MPTIFTKIIQGELPCYKVAETEDYLAFLDIRPLKLGHTLVIPKTEVDYIFNMDDPALSGLMLFAKKVALALEKEVTCKRIGVAVIGLEVPHTHIHLIPIDKVGDINFGNPPRNIAPDDMASLAERIHAHFVD
jgi:histidine triad (HIT) family protein